MPKLSSLFPMRLPVKHQAIPTPPAMAWAGTAAEAVDRDRRTAPEIIGIGYRCASTIEISHKRHLLCSIRDGLPDERMLHREYAPVSQLSVLATLHGVDFHANAVAVQDTRNQGSGVFALRDITAPEDDLVPLMTIPQDLVISLENVWIMAKFDLHLRQVLEALGEYAKTSRGAILLFLLIQLTHNATGGTIGTAGFFSSYVKFLPQKVNLPTFWTKSDREAIEGTSLDSALTSKLASLDREFSLLREKTQEISWCQQVWWDRSLLCLDDWKLIDALYRSRGMEMPDTGHVMVPLLDMANHTSGNETIALYETDLDGNVVLLLRPGKTLTPGTEVTISYGDDKGACEMIFSYGFLEESMTSAKELFLDLEIPDDDPLKLAKQRVAKCAPGFRLVEEASGRISWDGPYVWLLCVNEEDGLEFRVLQTTDGQRELQVSWKDEVLQDFDCFDRLIQQDPQKELFQLRAISIVRTRLEANLKRLSQHDYDYYLDSCGCRNQEASKLRHMEYALIHGACEQYEHEADQEVQQTVLCETEVVRQFLASVQEADEDFT